MYSSIDLRLIEDFKDLRLNLVKKVFKDVTSQWSRNFVIYPLSSCEDIQIMM